MPAESQRTEARRSKPLYSNVLAVIDMQNDFITGPLGNEGCVGIVPLVAEIIKNGCYDKVYVTMDTHNEDYLSTQEGKNLPVCHCMAGTEGWKIVPVVKKALDERGGYVVIEKDRFASVDLANAITQDCAPYASVDIVGVCTDICVVSNAVVIKTFNPEMTISVISDACAGTTGENHEAALRTMASNHFKVVRSEDRL